MNTFLTGLKTQTNYGLTENGAVKHNTTQSKVLDMFAMCGAYRNRSDEDCIVAFQSALQEDVTLAMKCLFYLRDIRGGQGERRFFRVCFKWLCTELPEVAIRNLDNISEFGRWDDLIYGTLDTPVFEEAMTIVKKQLILDLDCKTPSLLGKWLPSENASSRKTKIAGSAVRNSLGWTHKEYRKVLSSLREKINIVETLMSENRWDEIEFDKIPSKAGLVYRNAFARRDIIKAKYEKFAKDKTTKVNAEVLNPVDIADKCVGLYYHTPDSTERAMLDKYWENLKDYYNGRQENGIAVVDVSGSMCGQPMNAAVSMGTYIAERGKGAFANHFITFSNRPELVEIQGVDIYDKFARMKKADWGMSTNLEAVLDLLLKTALSSNKDDMPERLYIFSDMEFNRAISNKTESNYECGCLANRLDKNGIDTLIEKKKKEWSAYGVEMPQIIFWNLDSRNQNIPAIGEGFSYVSGFSMNMVECILSGKDGYDLMLEKLLSERYAVIQ